MLLGIGTTLSLRVQICKAQLDGEYAMDLAMDLLQKLLQENTPK